MDLPYIGISLGRSFALLYGCYTNNYDKMKLLILKTVFSRYAVYVLCGLQNID